MLQNDIIPVVNENDTTSTEELNFGDNDQLSSHVAEFINADQLFMLTGSDGVKDAKNQNIVSLDMKMLSKRSLESFEAKCVQEKSTQGRQLSDEQIKILEGYIEDKKQRDPGFEVPEWNYTNTA